MSHYYLVGVDTSECSTRALEFAIQKAKLTGASLLLAYVIEWSPYTFNTAEENALRHKRREEEVDAATQSILRDALKECDRQDVKAEAVVRHGNVEKTFIKLAEKYDARQIILGRSGESSLKIRFLGAVTSKLVQMVQVPITIVP